MEKGGKAEDNAEADCGCISEDMDTDRRILKRLEWMIQSYDCLIIEIVKPTARIKHKKLQRLEAFY